MVFGVTGALLSPLFGYLTRHTSQVVFIVFMLMVSISNSILMLTWIPNPKNPVIIFYMAIAFGISQAYANGQVRSLFIIHISPNKSVYCFATLFQTLGFLSGFLLSLLSCTNIKLIFYFCLVAFSLICYIILIWRENRYAIEKTLLRQIDVIDNSTNTEYIASQYDMSKNIDIKF